MAKKAQEFERVFKGSDDPPEFLTEADLRKKLYGQARDVDIAVEAIRNGGTFSTCFAVYQLRK